MTYQSIGLEPTVPNFNFTWLSKFCVFSNQKTPFSPNNAKKQNCSLSFKLGHVTYQNIRLESRVSDFHFTWLSK
jgi:hypothetical protein